MCPLFTLNLLYAIILQELNLAVVGSQIIGVVPLKALMESADFYMSRDNLFILDDDQKIRLVRQFSYLSIINCKNIGALCFSFICKSTVSCYYFLTFLLITY